MALKRMRSVASSIDSFGSGFFTTASPYAGPLSAKCMGSFSVAKCRLAMDDHKAMQKLVKLRPGCEPDLLPGVVSGGPRCQRASHTLVTLSASSPTMCLVKSLLLSAPSTSTSRYRKASCRTSAHTVCGWNHIGTAAAANSAASCSKYGVQPICWQLMSTLKTEPSSNSGSATARAIANQAKRWKPSSACQMPIAPSPRLLDRSAGGDKEAGMCICSISSVLAGQYFVMNL
mmetsp:Transcript_45344/g.81988  ORF Transcript_45344/g.81988 Transcript_45344/m.81988 type:complete len:231 (+) Transcript_45344:169-861(+)